MAATGCEWPISAGCVLTQRLPDWRAHRPKRPLDSPGKHTAQGCAAATLLRIPLTAVAASFPGFGTFLVRACGICSPGQPSHTHLSCRLAPGPVASMTTRLDLIRPYQIRSDPIHPTTSRSPPRPILSPQAPHLTPSPLIPSHTILSRPCRPCPTLGRMPSLPSHPSLSPCPTPPRPAAVPPIRSVCSELLAMYLSTPKPDDCPYDLVRRHTTDAFTGPHPRDPQIVKGHAERTLTCERGCICF